MINEAELKKKEQTMLKNLRIARRYNNLTLKSCGDVIGVSESNYSNIERGKVRLSGVALYMMCEAFEEKVETMFDPNYIAILKKRSAGDSEYLKLLDSIEKKEEKRSEKAKKNPNNTHKKVKL